MGEEKWLFVFVQQWIVYINQNKTVYEKWQCMTANDYNKKKILKPMIFKKVMIFSSYKILDFTFTFYSVIKFLLFNSWKLSINLTISYSILKYQIHKFMLSFQALCKIINFEAQWAVTCIYDFRSFLWWVVKWALSLFITQPIWHLRT